MNAKVSVGFVVAVVCAAALATCEQSTAYAQDRNRDRSERRSRDGGSRAEPQGSRTPARNATEPRRLAAWLRSHPEVAAAIKWEFIDGPKSYHDWPVDMKESLWLAFEAAQSGKSIERVDPPENIADKGQQRIAQAITERAAWSLYISHIANGLLLETAHKLQWSVAKYETDELAILFDSREFFHRNEANDFTIHGSGVITPAPPDVVLAFLQKHRMISNTRLQTIGALLEWCRGMTHYSGGLIMENMDDHWQYRGYPPVSRILSGTHRNREREKRHFTAGCSGTAGFLRAVLRVVNIPVTFPPTSTSHRLVGFPTEGKFLSHGDDPYSRYFSGLKNVPATALLIDKKTFDAWFGPKVDPEVASDNVGRRPRELADKFGGNNSRKRSR